MHELKPGAWGALMSWERHRHAELCVFLGFPSSRYAVTVYGGGGRASPSMGRVAAGGVVMRRVSRALSEGSVWQSICSPAQSVSRGWNRTRQLSSSCPERRRLFSAACRDSPPWRVLLRCSQTSLGWLTSAARGVYLQGDLGERVRNRWRRVIRERRDSLHRRCRK